MPPILSTAELTAKSQYPPQRERARIDEMERYARFDADILDSLIPGESLRIKPQLYSFISEFWRDQIMDSPPTISYEGGGRQDDIIGEMYDALMSASEVVVYDMVRFGMGCYHNIIPLQPLALDPRGWFPIRSAKDLNVGTTDIVAYGYSTDTQNLANNRISITVLDNATGRATERDYHFEGLTVGAAASEVTERLVGTPAVIPVRHGHGFYGKSLFKGISTYVTDIIRRESGLSEALDRHINPHLAIPEGALQVDDTGQVQLSEDGMAIPVPEGAQLPGYITWDPSYTAQHESITRAMERILMKAAIAPVLVDPTKAAGSIASGVAIRRLALPTVKKIRQIRNRLTDAIKDTIVGNAALYGAAGGEIVEMDRDSIRVVWGPELATSVFDEADSVSAIVGAEVLSPERAAEIIESGE